MRTSPGKSWRGARRVGIPAQSPAPRDELSVMHFSDKPTVVPATPPTPADGPWWRTLNRYQWFVLIVATLGWLFDTMDQQLFNIARTPAMRALVADRDVIAYGTYAT